LILNKNIILTGFMGSGKSTIGRLVAKKLENSYFLDTDSLIESFENREINEIFAIDGEEYFRDAEKKVFQWITKNVKNSIISTGGGLPIFIPEIRDAGIVIYLKVPFETIVKRFDESDIEKRPLFQELNEAEKLFNKRDSIYSELADFTVKNENIDETLSQIDEIIKWWGVSE
jgi:shikimate kinase